MNGYGVAWLVIGACASLGAVAFFFVLRNLSIPWLRTVLIAGAIGFFLTPAPVPNYPDNWAPAFVVLIFETLFQSDGSPAVGLRLLLLGMTLCVTVAVLVRMAFNRLRSGSPAGANADV